ncbi:Mental retardation GTPase activating protein [Citrus sinensis]|uniref:Mental retardation GTPase activating protein n=1 Tax=Citrus sinensis TaxID=2711 RepID=A0ACB8K349_CITSI|nr:Mental retardation GTPase activating protein [Citrus sinensis]
MASVMEQTPYSSRRHDLHHEAAASDSSRFNLREWALKARMISRENTNSRRFSASNIRSFREDTRSFRSNITISSTASSPGYPLLREEIDPSTYSFTTALKALQARNVYNSWECLSPDGFALNSKWNEAEKYICNPLSGEFPMECLSAKTLSARSFRNLTNTLTMSAPLVYNSDNHSRNMIQTKPSQKHCDATHFPISEISCVTEKKMEGMSSTRDVGTQSTPYNLSSASSPSPASTPSIAEGSLKRCEAAEGEDSPNSNAKLKPEQEVEMKETREKEETKKDDNKEDQKKKGCTYNSCSSSSSRQAGCLSWMRKRQRDKRKPRKKHNFFPRLKGC